MARLLIDTGSGRDRDRSGDFEPTESDPTGMMTIHTPSSGATPHQINQYDVSLVIPHQAINRTFLSSFNLSGLARLFASTS
jgi:hypothetical protein